MLPTINDTLAYLALNLCPSLGPIKARKILAAMDLPESPEALFSTSRESLLKIPGVGPVIADHLQNPLLLKKAARELEQCEERGIDICTERSPNYPVSLTHYGDAPLLLYVWGELQPGDADAVGVVGTRGVTSYGREITKELSYQLARSGLTIVSGLARGVDTLAHEAALAAEGRTIGILGSGLSQLYPPENLPLAQKIADGNGAIISEFPLNSPPDRQSFPIRNRIVASWVKSLVVTESPVKSGSLITANMAAERGKNVYAIPGQVNRAHSAGCHQLIREGATLITSAQDILQDENWFSKPKISPASQAIEGPESLNHSARSPGSPHPEHRDKQGLLRYLSSPSSPEELAEQLEEPIQSILSQLTELELEGRVMKDAAGFYYQT